MNFLFFLYRTIKVSLRVNSLEIESAGLESDMPFVKLINGLTFYGQKSRKKELKYYNILLKKKLKKKLPSACFKLAKDIIIRYYDGGLKLGGPKKEKLYKVKKDDIVVEMGAYMGHYSMYLSERIGGTGRLIAIEPMDDNLIYLKMNKEKNHLTNISIVEKGVWDKKESLTFSRSHNDTQSSSATFDHNNRVSFEIPVDSLDNIFKDQDVNHVDFMIIQLNGAELTALKGLQVIKPLNIAIAARYGDIQKEIINLLRKRGYAVTVENRVYIYASLLN